MDFVYKAIIRFSGDICYDNQSYADYELWYKSHIQKIVWFRRYGHTKLCVQNHETWLTSRTHSSNCDGDITWLEHVFIKLILCSIQWYKFCVCRRKGSRDRVTQNYRCAPKSLKKFSRAHSFLSDGDLTFTYPYELQSLLHPTVQVSCP